IYLPRSTPSASKTPTLTWVRPRSSTILRASAALRIFSGFNGMRRPPLIGCTLPWRSRGCQTAEGRTDGAGRPKGKGAEAPFPLSIGRWLGFADGLLLGRDLRLTPGDDVADRRARETGPGDPEPEDGHDHQQAARVPA